ncbi:hypothetical protein [Pseudonocardia sp. TRM90224]|uniref:hypothetical protein n=1 Tax=Pseudonocardia sp. TRM90224 TaxID=2812678 RepID=UPI001E5BA2EF|nr:hypothetical protein [Pseudonocardia sp. TRM90224]
MTTITRKTVPATVNLAVLTWLFAVAAGVGEAVVRMQLPDAPTLDALAMRFGIYAVVVAIVLALRTGYNPVRWTLAIGLGVVGTLSLILEPITWWLAGGSPVEFLATADGPTLAITALRALHVLAVFTALALMFHPRSAPFFRKAPRP